MELSFWERDFNGLDEVLADLQAKGMTNVRAYVAEHPEVIRRMIEVSRVVDVNDKSVALFGAQREDLLGSVDQQVDRRGAWRRHSGRDRAGWWGRVPGGSARGLESRNQRENVLDEGRPTVPALSPGARSNAEPLNETGWSRARRGQPALKGVGRGGVRRVRRPSSSPERMATVQVAEYMRQTGAVDCMDVQARP